MRILKYVKEVRPVYTKFKVINLSVKDSNITLETGIRNNDITKEMGIKDSNITKEKGIKKNNITKETGMSQLGYVPAYRNWFLVKL